MRIDVARLLDGQLSELDVSYSYTPDGEGAQLPGNVRLTGPISVSCHVVDNHGYMRLYADATALYETSCDRCLAPITREIAFSIERMIETGAGGRRDAEDAEADDADDILPMVGGTVEIDAELTEALVLSIPMLHLCREDCPGLCFTCGKRLADGPCDCKKEKEIDPRLAILQKLLEKPQ